MSTCPVSAARSLCASGHRAGEQAAFANSTRFWFCSALSFGSVFAPAAGGGAVVSFPWWEARRGDLGAGTSAPGLGSVGLAELVTRQALCVRGVDAGRQMHS